MKKIGLWMVLGMFALSMAGCGTPSKSDVCGDCDDLTKTICEGSYDSCNDDGDCIDLVEENLGC